MKLAICTKFHVNQMNFVRSRRGGGGGPIDPTTRPRLRATIFSSRLLELKNFYLELLITNTAFITKRQELYKFHIPDRRTNRPLSRLQDMMGN